MTTKDKEQEIAKLNAKLRELREEIENDVKEKHKHLIGRCFKPNDHTYFRIVHIHGVSISDGTITVGGIAIHTNVKDRIVPLDFDGFTFITESVLKELEISREEFSKEFDKVVAEIKKDLGL